MGVVDDRTASYADGTTCRTVTYDDGTAPLVTTTPPAGGDEANRQSLVAKLPVALAANITAYDALALAQPEPTVAQLLTQVQALTLQVNALIRLRLGTTALDTTSGT